MSRSTLIEHAIVIKHTNTGETDRIITLLTQEIGKIAVVAKGVRRSNSSRSSTLEPGNSIRCTLITTKGLPIITQALLMQDASHCRDSLAKMRRLHQLLEIFDRLLVEEELDEETYTQITKLYQGIIRENQPVGWVRTELITLITLLGFELPSAEDGRTVLDHVAELSGKPLKSYDFLLVKQSV